MLPTYSVLSAPMLNASGGAASCSSTLWHRQRRSRDRTRNWITGQTLCPRSHAADTVAVLKRTRPPSLFYGGWPTIVMVHYCHPLQRSVEQSMCANVRATLTEPKHEPEYVAASPGLKQVNCLFRWRSGTSPVLYPVVLSAMRIHSCNVFRNYVNQAMKDTKKQTNENL